jgi:hypothetical protein
LLITPARPVAQVNVLLSFLYPQYTPKNEVRASDSVCLLPYLPLHTTLSSSSVHFIPTFLTLLSTPNIFSNYRKPSVEETFDDFDEIFDDEWCPGCEPRERHPNHCPDEIMFNLVNSFLALSEHTEGRPTIPLHHSRRSLPLFIRDMPSSRNSQSDLTPFGAQIENDSELNCARVMNTTSSFDQANQLANKPGGLSITSNSTSMVFHGPNRAYVLTEVEREALARLAEQTTQQRRAYISRSFDASGKKAISASKKRNLTRLASNLGPGGADDGNMSEGEEGCVSLESDQPSYGR